MLKDMIQLITRLTYTGNNYDLSQAVKAANCVLDDERFFKLVEEIESFDMSSYNGNEMSGKQFTRILRNNQIIGSVIVYRPKWCFSKAYGYYSGGKDIFLNERKLIRDSNRNVNISSLAGSLVHEYVHMLDNFVPAYLGHGDNSPIGKEKTTPYLVGKMAKEFIFRNYIKV
jgi:hypothetical protein